MALTDTWKQITTQQITIDPARCIGCGACAQVCPFMVYQMRKNDRGKKLAVPLYQEDCFLCQSCQAQCPTDAITIVW